ncbi:MAG: hypothetical protein FWG63_09620 [Defluviitaleaceae bacterium]|nr:hypothetical protein [Defluviitaleaceae bacterium]
MKLREIAHSRAGDKGNLSTISVIVYKAQDYDTIRSKVTVDLVQRQFAHIGATSVERYELPQLGALNFVLHNTLNGGVMRSLAIDTHGKSLSGLMLELEI